MVGCPKPGSLLKLKPQRKIGEFKYHSKGNIFRDNIVGLDGIMAASIGKKEYKMASKSEHMALLTWACRSMPLLAASTSGCGAGEG